MTTEQMSAIEIQEQIVGAFQSAGDYLNFMQSDDNNAAAWARINKVEIESELEYNEAISRIKLSFKEAALNRMECDIKGREFDQDDSYLPLFRHASQDEIATMAEMNYDEARERIAEDGTLF